MRVILINMILGGSLGGYLAHLGYGAATMTFWVVFGIAFLMMANAGIK